MRCDPAIGHSRFLRLKRYDYSKSGAYFITICMQERLCLFGHVVNNQMAFNNAGLMIEKRFDELKNKFLSIICDTYNIMPNHVHFVLINKQHYADVADSTVPVGADLCVCPYEKYGGGKRGDGLPEGDTCLI